eukprot:7381521-Prymnesium_polylepis.2
MPNEYTSAFSPYLLDRAYLEHMYSAVPMAMSPVAEYEVTPVCARASSISIETPQSMSFGVKSLMRQMLAAFTSRWNTGAACERCRKLSAVDTPTPIRTRVFHVNGCQAEGLSSSSRKMCSRLPRAASSYTKQRGVVQAGVKPSRRMMCGCWKRARTASSRSALVTSFSRLTANSSPSASPR